jgi:hypothetical protein
VGVPEEDVAEKKIVRFLTELRESQQKTYFDKKICGEDT